MSSDIEIEGLDEFEKSLTKFIEQTYPKEFEDMVIKVAVDLQNAKIGRASCRERV